MPITLPLQHHITTHSDPSPRALAVAVMFGLSIDGTSEQTIVPPIELTLAPGQIIFITGVSGGGKSTLLRLIDQALTNNYNSDAASSPALVCVDRLPALADRALVEALANPESGEASGAAPAELETVCHWLSRAGLNDAVVMLRRPSALSEGQRYRLRLAQAMAVAERQPRDWAVLLADEFGSTLDRTTARALAKGVRRWVTRSRVCLVAATAHDDLLEPLCPDVLVDVSPAGCAVHTRPL